MSDDVIQDPLARLVHNRYMEAKDKSGDWRDEAERAFGYVAGDQWAEEDRMILESQGRPPITFNRTEIFVSAVTGLEALNRNEVRYFPRKPGQDQGTADLWTAAAEYVNDDADAEVHHSAAFRDLVICGMGWTDTRMDYETNPDGDIQILHRDPMRMYWDPRARQRNLRDGRWVMYVGAMSWEEVKQTWPAKAQEITGAKLFSPEFEQAEPHDANKAWMYENDQSRSQPREGEDVWVAQYQWYEREMFYRVQFEDGTRDFPVKDWEKYVERVPALNNFRRVGPFAKRNYKQAFVAGTVVLEVTDLPGDDFTLQCMTGKHDPVENVWYGMVRPLFDPQDWVNKLYSQIMHIINSNAKGGLLAEKDAFDSVAKAEEDWASADSIVWTKPGAIQNSKIQPKPEAKYPVGLDRLLTFAMNMFQDVTGANLELLGLAEKVQPGVLEAQRKQAGLTILAWAFDSMRAYRKRHGRVLAQFIAEFIADGRLIRISGDKGVQYLPLLRDQLSLEYDVVVQESPQSVNEKERTFAVLMQLLPSMVQMGLPLPPSLLEYLPIPQALIEEMKRGDPQQQQQQQMAAELAVAEKQADVAKTEAEAKYKEAQALTEKLKAVTGG